MRGAKNPQDRVSRILDLSRRVSLFSPAMKPFVRFAPGKPGDGFYRRHLWDFDDLLQKKLLRLLRQAASPGEIARACARQWKQNSLPLLRAERGRLENGIIEVTEPPYAATRRDILQEHLGRDSRVLYVGCGTGRDCLAWARDGLRVVGIDTDVSLAKLARNWSDHLCYPASFAGMDMMELGFKPGTFDGLLLELYGGIPDSGHAALLRRELARVLRPDGVGLVVAERKMYSCWWFLMGSSWPDEMVQWLRGQVILDFRFGTRDGCEERLQYGLYSRCHTTESLSSELSRTFEVLSCRYQADPRYVLAVVRNTAGLQGNEMLPERNQPETAAVSAPVNEGFLENTECFCRQLERHAGRMASYFRAGGSGAGCLTELAPGAETVLSMLEQLVGRGGAGAEPARSIAASGLRRGSR